MRLRLCVKQEQKQACEACWGDLLLAAAHLCRLRVVKLLNECAEKSGSPERLLMFGLPIKHMDEVISLLCENRRAGKKEQKAPCKSF